MNKNRNRTRRIGVGVMTVSVLLSILVSPAGAVLKPTAPASLQAAPGDAVVALSWQTSDGGGVSISEYRIYRGPGCEVGLEGDHGCDLLAAVAGDRTGYRDTDVINGGTYGYRVTAVSALGTESDPSNFASASPQGPGLPSAPQNLTASADPCRRGNHIRVDLAWQPPLDEGDSPILRYEIYRFARLIGSVDADHLSYKDQAPRWNRETTDNWDLSGRYWVVAVNSHGAGPRSNIVDVSNLCNGE